MKEFNLQEYLKNPLQKVALRSGSDVRIICIDKKGEFPIVALVEDDEEGEFVVGYRKTGRFYIERKSSNDLVFAPIKREGWMNIYRSDNDTRRNVGNVYPSEKEAKEHKVFGYIKTIKIEWEE